MKHSEKPPRLNHSRWLLLLAGVMLLSLSGIEANYQWGVRFPRNEVDSRLADIEQIAPGRHYRAVLLSDSSTHNPMRSFEVAPDVLDLSTTNAPKLLGMQLMMDRFWKKGASTENLVLFMRPDFANLPMGQVPASIFLYFDRTEEIAALQASGVKGYSAGEVYAKNRIDSLNFFNGLLMRGRLAKMRYDRKYSVEKGIIAPRLETITDYQIGAPARRLLESLAAECRAHDTQLILVLSPVMSRDYTKMQGSEVQGFFKELVAERGVRYFEANAMGHFTDETFFDSMHPRANWGKYYLDLIDREIVRLFRD